MLTNATPISYSIFYSQDFSQSILGCHYLSPQVLERGNTVIEYTEALFGKIKYSLLEAKLSTSADGISTFSSLPPATTGLLAKISKLVPYFLHLMVTL